MEARADDKDYETFSKDYEFSRTSMREHWEAGYSDTVETLAHPDWPGTAPAFEWPTPSADILPV